MDRSKNVRRAPGRDRDYDDETGDSLENEPEIAGKRSGLGFAALSGIATGILSSAISIGLTLANSVTYQQASNNPQDLGLQYILSGFWCLNVIVALALSFGVGFVAGKRTLQRSYGFIAGAIASLIIFAGNFLVVYIPGYPSRLIGSVAIGTPSVGMAIVADLVAILLLGMVLGLFGLWGASVATRHLRARDVED